MRVPSGTPIFDAASWNGIAIDSTCGGHGTCKKCKVRIVEGDVPVGRVDPRAFSPDELRAGWRLACRATAATDLVVEVPPLQTRPKAALVGVGRHVILRPSVQKRYLELEEPTLEDQRSDVQRLLDGIDDLEPTVDLEVAKTLGRILRDAQFKVTAVVCDEALVAVEPGDTTGRRYAIAFDLGTTTVVATLLDLETGTPRGGPLDAQPPAALRRRRDLAGVGDDARRRRARRAAGAGVGDARPARARGLRGGGRRAGGRPRDDDLRQRHDDPARARHRPRAAVDGAVHRHRPRAAPARAADFGVHLHPRAPAFVFPSLGAYVGGDIVAGLLATGLTRDRRVRLFIDVGTNSEIALGSAERVVATAAPAGPAFEAAQIRCGMRAADGAIEGVKIVGDEFRLQVIGDAEPVGMCGSGLVDCVAELVQSGLLDHSGRFIPDEAAAELHPGLAPRLTKIGEERVFVMHWRGEDPANAVFLSQRDVRELQFAKASIATGWHILLGELGLEPGDIQQVLLAGSFGAYLSPASAIRIGLVPRMALPRIVSAGNVAGEGAKMAALSLRERAEARSILDEVEYVELSGRADFNDAFIDQLAFPG